MVCTIGKSVWQANSIKNTSGKGFSEVLPKFRKGFSEVLPKIQKGFSEVHLRCSRHVTTMTIKMGKITAGRNF